MLILTLKIYDIMNGDIYMEWTDNMIVTNKCHTYASKMAYLRCLSMPFTCEK